MFRRKKEKVKKRILFGVLAFLLVFVLYLQVTSNHLSFVESILKDKPILKVRKSKKVKVKRVSWGISIRNF